MVIINDNKNERTNMETVRTQNSKKEEMKTSKNTPWWRWIITLVAGVLLWEVGNLISGIVASVIAGEGEALIGSVYPMIIYSVLRALIFTFGIKYTWKIVDGGLSSIGFEIQNWKQDTFYGAAVGVGLAVIQYLVVLPLTGGALRSDIIAASEMVGTNYSTLVAAIILGLAGAMSEELFFRGHIIRSFRGLFGVGRLTLVVSSLISIGLFASGHAYQGLSGVINTGFIGLVYTILYLRRGSLTSGIVAHSVSNTLAFLGIFFLL
jgi:membrane protease YdiL (CAAX protease family)